jgi:hypothetical protein
MEPDIHRRLTCWPPMGFIESSIGRLALFSLTFNASSEMKTKLQDKVLGGRISEVEFARAAAPFICFPAEKLREGQFRPSEPLLSEEQCAHLSEPDLQCIAQLYTSKELHSAPEDDPLKVFISDFTKQWMAENETAATEARKVLFMLGKRIEILAAHGIDIDRLSSEQLFRLIREPEALRTYEEFLDVLTFAMHGWFIDPHMPVSFIREAAAILRGHCDQEGEGGEDPSEEFQVALVQYFATRYQEIKANILRSFSERAILLDQAFSAHENGLYSLAIPVFIAQADGAFREKRGMPLFAKFRPKYNPDFAKILESLKRKDFDSHEIAWREYLPLAFYFTTQGVIPFRETVAGGVDCSKPSFSRHAIMHGLTTAYGTHENSLRYISLLGYLAWCLTSSG